MPHPTRDRPFGSEFLRALAQGVILGTVLLVVATVWMHVHPSQRVPQVKAPSEPAASVSRPREVRRLADFGGLDVSADVRQVANWSFFTHDNQGHSVVILDKKAATVYAFDPSGRLVASAPVLLGLAVGDDSEPGIGDKPLSEIRDDEKTTPAGRFVAEAGENTEGEDIGWIDYDEALALHRVIAGTPAERRAERLASPNPKDRRTSFGCINLPPAFYDGVLSPAVRKTGAIVYVLPEIKSMQQVFGSWDVTDPAARPPATPAPRTEPAPVDGRPPHAYREAPVAVTSDSAAAR